MFPYFGRKIAYNNSNWAAVYLNLCKAWRWWGVIERDLERTGSTIRSRVEMYKAVAQLVLLYENKSWVVDMEVLKVLTVFQNQVE